MKTFCERLNEAMNLRDMRSIDLAHTTGISKARISQYVNGVYEAKQTALYLLASALRVSEAWLMGYDVPMEKDYSPAEKISEGERVLLDLFRSLSDEKKEMVIAMLRAALQPKG
jgi:transcriptional regulator with XRE-family HTH domain